MKYARVIIKSPPGIEMSTSGTEYLEWVVRKYEGWVRQITYVNSEN